MAKHISFPSIEQFRNVVRTVQERCRFHEVPLPTLRFHGTVKLHGTNASVVYYPFKDEMWAQSREQVISVGSDNAGFARFVEDNKADFKKMFEQMAAEYGGAPGHKAMFAIYGEWCGKGIQKGVAVNQLDKRFVVFAARFVEPEDDKMFDGEGWFDEADTANLVMVPDLASPLIDCIEKYDTWDIDIDMANPQVKQNELGELTLAVEQECPYSKAHGVSGVGEGIVWRCTGVATYKMIKVPTPYRTEDLAFKVKGEKHSDTKVTKLASVDLEKVASIKEFVEKVVTDHRLEKGIDYLKATATRAPFRLDVQLTGDFLRWIGNDVIKEESELMTESGLERKEVMSQVNKVARQWFMTRLNEEIMGRPPEEPGTPCIAVPVKG